MTKATSLPRCMVYILELDGHILTGEWSGTMHEDSPKELVFFAPDGNTMYVPADQMFPRVL